MRLARLAGKVTMPSVSAETIAPAMKLGTRNIIFVGGIAEASTRCAMPWAA